MLNKITNKGTLAQRPLPYADGVFGTYFFCTDCDGGKYYYSTGEKWEARTIDATELDPATDSQIICGISADGSINPVKLDASGGIKVSGGSQGPFTSRSGTIASANTSQAVVAANLSRNFFFFQNISDTDMYLGIGAAASTSSMLIPKNGGGMGFDVFVPTNAINVLCTAQGKNFVAFEG